MDDRTNSDRGFTLIEVVIVVLMIGIITAAVSASVAATLRHTPPTEVRADDARSMQGLVTWLPQDVDATPPNGFNRDTTYFPCAGVPTYGFGHNVLSAEWEERSGTTTAFAASYRYERVNGKWTMSRYVCDDGGTGTMGNAIRINLTSEMPEWDPADPPASIQMCSANVAADGSCPTADVIPTSVLAPDEDANGYTVKSLKMVITRADGITATIDAAPKNPDQDLSDDPSATSNQSPALSGSENYVHQMFAGETVVLDVGTTHGASDGDGDPISVALDSTEAIPTGLTVTTFDPLNVEITADPSLVDGTITDKIILIVSDNRAGWVDATIQIEILPQPNVAPTLSAFNYHLQMTASEIVVLPLETTHGVADANGDIVTATVVSYPVVELASAPSLGHPDPLDLEIRTTGGATVGPVAMPITIVFDDGNGGTVTGTITLEIIAPVVNNPPTATSANYDVSLYADDEINLYLDVTHGVGDPDGDVLTIASVNDPVGATTTQNGGLGYKITTDLGLVDGPLAAPIEITVQDPSGDTVVVTVTVTIVPRPEPPSDCALVSLALSTGVADRQGNGKQPHLLTEDVTITVTYSGSCDGLALNYDTGDTSGLGTNRVFPAGSPASIIVYGKGNGGTEKWAAGTHAITVSTTSDVSPNSLTVDLEVT